MNLKMNFKKGEIIELKITDLAFGGAGVGKLVVKKPRTGELFDGKGKSVGSGFTIFVKGAVPGDTIRAKLVKIKKNYAEARLEEILEASVQRILPRCKHFNRCGGCSLQFLDYKNQLKWKEKIVTDSLKQIGGFKNVRIEPIVGCESPWFYRNKMEYSFGESENGALMLGLHPEQNFKEVFDVEECFLEPPLSVKILRAVRNWCAMQNLRSNSALGLLRNLVIREGKNTGELMVNLVVSGEKFSLDEEFKNWILAEFPEITSLYCTAIKTQRGHRTVIKEYHLAGRETIAEKLKVRVRAVGGTKSNCTESGSTGDSLELKFEILPQAFFQPNTMQAQVLYGKILEFTEISSYCPAETGACGNALDLFCGTGTIGMFFAKTGIHTIGIEINESAIQNAHENAKLNNIENIEFHCCDVEKIPLRALNPLPSILITDPPRPGIAQKSLEKILALKIPKWIYVSCNPATLARDLKIACQNGYTLKKIQPVDMFPHTYHIEIICLLTD